MREKTNHTTKAEKLLVYGIAIFICVFFGPFDTGEDLVFWDRVVFWTIGIIASGLIIEYCMLAILEFYWFSKITIFLRFPIGAMIGAVPGAAIIITVNMVIRPDHLLDQSFISLWFKVSVMSLLIAGLDHLVWARFKADKEDEEEKSPPAPAAPIQANKPKADVPSLFQRLPHRLRSGQLISMSMQDHYVEVTTTLGSEMLLMRMSDAIDLLDGLPGVQTHRSHWVAKSHALSVAKTGRRFELILSDERRLPVSRSYQPKVERMFKE